MSQPVSATGVALPVGPEKPERIIVTGTGRAGTTFLMRIFTLLGLDTGYTPETMAKFTYANCNAGLERPISHKVLIIKNPTLLTTLAAQLKTFRIHVIIPFRDFTESAESRVKLGKKPGGLWDATDVSGQLDNYEKWTCKALVDIVQNDIPYTFLDFKRMISGPEYLFERLGWMMERFGVTYEQFIAAWTRASELSRPKVEGVKDISGSNQAEVSGKSTRI